MLAELVSINEHLASGINTYSLAEDYLGGDARKRLKDRVGRLKDRTINAAGSLRDKAKSAFGAGKEKVQKTLKDVTLGDIGVWRLVGLVPLPEVLSRPVNGSRRLPPGRPQRLARWPFPRSQA
jgi:hypothetical protein